MGPCTRISKGVKFYEVKLHEVNFGQQELKYRLLRIRVAAVAADFTGFWSAGLCVTAPAEACAVNKAQQCRPLVVSTPADFFESE